MLAGQRLKDLADARRLVVLRADLHRSLLRHEADALRERFASLAGTCSNPASGRPVWIAGAILAGLLATRRWRTLVRWAPTAVAAYRWLHRLTTK